MDLTFEQLEEQIGGNEDMVRLVRVLKGKFNFLCSSLEEKDQKIRTLEAKIDDFQRKYANDVHLINNEIVDLKERVLNSEMYNSKDTLIIQNPPLSDRNGDITGQVIEFLNHTFGSKLSKHDIKACHYLGKPGESAIIIKFIYFAHKNFLWRSKKALKGVQNPNNGRPIFLIERLPKVCRELQVEARNLGIKTVTNNCKVQVLCPKKEGNGVQFRPIHTMKELELIKENALKFNPPSSIIGVRGTKRPEREKSSGSGYTPENKQKAMQQQYDENMVNTE